MLLAVVVPDVLLPSFSVGLAAASLFVVGLSAASLFVVGLLTVSLFVVGLLMASLFVVGLSAASLFVVGLLAPSVCVPIVVVFLALPRRPRAVFDGRPRPRLLVEFGVVFDIRDPLGRPIAGLSGRGRSIFRVFFFFLAGALLTERPFLVRVLRRRRGVALLLASAWRFL